MSSETPSSPAISDTAYAVTIVASRYNERFTDALVDNCVDELAFLLPNAKVDVVRVPGAFEIPVTVEAVVSGAGDMPVPSVIVALGVIIQGDTEHAALVGKSVTHALMDIAVSSGIPVIHEVLLLDDEKQAEARCLQPEKNRGREAAGAAAAMAELFDSRFKSIQY